MCHASATRQASAACHASCVSNTSGVSTTGVLTYHEAVMLYCNLIQTFLHRSRFLHMHMHIQVVSTHNKSSIEASTGVVWGVAYTMRKTREKDNKKMPLYKHLSLCICVCVYIYIYTYIYIYIYTHTHTHGQADTQADRNTTHKKHRYMPKALLCVQEKPALSTCASTQKQTNEHTHTIVIYIRACFLFLHFFSVPVCSSTSAFSFQ